jgi:tetratricopeptide (TPR) repeat protein
MEFDRVVQVRVSALPGSAKVTFASGYLIAPDLVLTCAHVFGDRSSAGLGRVTVCHPGSSESRYGARLRWLRKDERVDAALVEIDGDCGWRPPGSLGEVNTRPPQRWGQLIGSRPQPAAAHGYPRMRKDAAGRLDEQFTGSIYPGTGRNSGRYEILSTSPELPLDPETGGAATKWSGMSGAALLCGDLLTGVIRQDRKAQGGTRLSATRSRDLLDDPEFKALATKASGWVPLLEPVEPTHLLSPAAQGRDLRSPAMLLRADTEAVSFHGRDREIARLTEWAAGGSANFSTQLIVGPGGQGKTRLARHLSSVLRDDGWLIAQLRPDLEDDGATDWSVLDTDLPMLLVADYAETVPRLIRKLIEHLRPTRHRTRLLLIARSTGDWLTDNLGATAESLALLAAAPVLELPPLLPQSSGSKLRATAFRGAIRDLAKLLGQVPAYQVCDWPAVARKAKVPAGLGKPVFQSALTLQVAALTSLLQRGGTPAETTTESTLESLLLSHEARYWERTASSPQFMLGDLRPITLRRAVAAAASFGAGTKAEAVAIIRRLPGLSAGRDIDVAEWLHALYPPPEGRYWGSLQPDRIAEYHSTLHLTGTDGDVHVALWLGASDNQRIRSVAVLSRGALNHHKAPRPQRAQDVFSTLEQSLRAEIPNTRVLWVVTSFVPPQTSLKSYPEYASLGLFLNQTLVNAYRTLAAEDPARKLPGLIEALNDLGLRHEAAGRRAEAIVALEESVALGRHQWKTFLKDSDAAIPAALPNALRNLSILRHVPNTQSTQASLSMALETVEMERFVIRIKPDSDRSFLARALYDVAWHMRRTKSYIANKEEILAYIQEATTLYRELAEVNPGYEPSLARVLSVLGLELDDLGRFEEGSRAAFEAWQLRYRHNLRLSPDPSAGL